MASEEKKGITVKIDAELHAEVRQYLETHGMTMAEFITMAIDDELHPKIVEQEEKTVEKMRTLAFQVNEELFQKVKDYLRRNNMSQKEFVIGLIETEIDRDLAEREALRLQREAEMRAAEDTHQEMDVTCDEEAVSEEADEVDCAEEQDYSSEAVEPEEEEETFGNAATADEEMPNYSEETIEEVTEEVAEDTETDASEEESDHEDEHEEMQSVDSAEETDVSEVFESESADEEDEVCDTELEDESEEDEEAEEEEMTMCM